MKKVVRSMSILACLLVAVVWMEARVAVAVTCNAAELSLCLPAVTGGKPPSALCCTRLRGQKPCLCGYLRNPALRGYVNSPGARRVASTCGVSIPNC